MKVILQALAVATWLLTILSNLATPYVAAVLGFADQNLSRNVILHGVGTAGVVSFFVATPLFYSGIERNSLSKAILVGLMTGVGLSILFFCQLWFWIPNLMMSKWAIAWCILGELLGSATTGPALIRRSTSTDNQSPQDER